MPRYVWPYDVLKTPGLREVKLPNHLVCFVLLKASPAVVWDDRFELIARVCEEVGKPHGVRLEARRAIDLASSDVIQHEIWEEIRAADIIIADLTAHNPNVLLELGVAAATKPKEHIILLQELSDQPGLFPSDLQPARFLTYNATARGFQRLSEQLGQALRGVLAALPFDEVKAEAITLPLHVPLDGGRDDARIWTGALTHRRIMPQYLEFGAPYSFPHSWAAAGDLSPSNVRVRAQMKFTTPLEHVPDEGFLGVAVRAQSYPTNMSFFPHVYKNGSVHLSLPSSDLNGYMPLPNNGMIGDLGALNRWGEDGFIPFDVSVDDTSLRLRVGIVEHAIRLRDMAHVWTRGRILFQTLRARAALRRVQIDPID